MLDRIIHLYLNQYVIASGIFGFACSSLIYRKRMDDNVDIQKLYREIEKSFIRKLGKEKGVESKWDH